jgi:crotonobetainyl-CoA:carnitine CoA-transferase CaiB-like acyl-CoA transferase
MGPLTTIRIIDMTTVLMGPYATQMLGDFGADVIKVEAPEGDLVRKIGPARHDGMGPIYLNANRSKRSITLDLKQAEGRAALLRLCADADVLVYNVRAKAMKRLGLSYEEVSAVNPKIVYAGMFGYGQDGPYAARPAYDDLIQGGATIPYLFSRVNLGQPRYVPSAIADRVVGLAAVGAILASIVERDRTGLGQRVDIPMFETMVSFVLGDHMGGLTFEPPLDAGGYSRQLSPDRRPYQTMDGYVCALIYTDGHWQRFFAAIGRPDMPAADPRFASFVARMAHIDEVYGELTQIFLTRTSAEWLDLLEEADVPAMPMYDFQGVLQDPHLVATDFFRVVEHPSEGAPLAPRATRRARANTAKRCFAKQDFRRKRSPICWNAGSRGQP